MAANKLKVIPDILEEHFEELAFLWGQRQEALYSPEYTLPELLELEERIEAHVQGLLVGAEHTIPFVDDGLSQDEPLEVFAASYTLLRLNIDSAARQVMDAFFQAEGPQLEGIREALCHGPIDMVMGRLHEAVTSAPAPIAAAAAEALAFHGKLDPAIPRLAKFFQDKNAKVRRAAWRLIMLVPAPGLLSPEVSAQLSDAATHDEDPVVKAEALQRRCYFAAGYPGQTFRSGTNSGSCKGGRAWAPAIPCAGYLRPSRRCRNSAGSDAKQRSSHRCSGRSCVHENHRGGY